MIQRMKTRLTSSDVPVPHTSGLTTSLVYLFHFLAKLIPSASSAALFVLLDTATIGGAAINYTDVSARRKVKNLKCQASLHTLQSLDAYKMQGNSFHTEIIHHVPPSKNMAVENWDAICMIDKYLTWWCVGKQVREGGGHSLTNRVVERVTEACWVHMQGAWLEWVKNFITATSVIIRLMNRLKHVRFERVENLTTTTFFIIYTKKALGNENVKRCRDGTPKYMQTR